LETKSLSSVVFAGLTQKKINHKSLGRVCRPLAVQMTPLETCNKPAAFR